MAYFKLQHSRSSKNASAQGSAIEAQKNLCICAVYPGNGNIDQACRMIYKWTNKYPELLYYAAGGFALGVMAFT